MSHSIKRMTKRQRAWCENYQQETGFEPLMDDYLAGNTTFSFSAKKSVRWFEDWANDAHLNIGRDIPSLPKPTCPLASRRSNATARSCWKWRSLWREATE